MLFTFDAIDSVKDLSPSCNKTPLLHLLTSQLGSCFLACYHPSFSYKYDYG